MAPAQAKQPPPPGSVSEPRVQGGQRSWLVWIRRRRRRDPSPLIGPPGSAGGSLPLAGRWRWELTPVGRGRACPALSLMESSSSLLFFQHHRSQHALHDADDLFFSSSRRVIHICPALLQLQDVFDPPNLAVSSDRRPQKTIARSKSCEL